MSGLRCSRPGKGFAGQPSLWRIAGNEAGHDNLCAFQREIAEKDLSLTHTIVHPIVDKRVPDYEGVNEQLALKKVGETQHSIIVSGARILATLGPFADELAVYPAHPIPEASPEIAMARPKWSPPVGSSAMILNSVSSACAEIPHPAKPRMIAAATPRLALPMITIAPLLPELQQTG